MNTDKKLTSKDPRASFNRRRTGILYVEKEKSHKKRNVCMKKIKLILKCKNPFKKKKDS